jgi:hypothetical protein
MIFCCRGNHFIGKKAAFECGPGLPDFSPYNIPKQEKYTKTGKYIPNSLTVDPVAVK